MNHVHSFILAMDNQIWSTLKAIMWVTWIIALGHFCSWALEPLLILVSNKLSSLFTCKMDSVIILLFSILAFFFFFFLMLRKRSKLFWDAVLKKTRGLAIQLKLICIQTWVSMIQTEKEVFLVLLCVCVFYWVTFLEKSFLLRKKAIKEFSQAGGSLANILIFLFLFLLGFWLI